MAVKTPSVTPGVWAAGIALVCQLLHLGGDAKDNITTLALAAAAADTAVRVGRQKWVSKLMADRDHDLIPDWLENTSLAWRLVFVLLGLFVGTTVALALLLAR